MSKERRVCQHCGLYETSHYAVNYAVNYADGPHVSGVTLVCPSATFLADSEAGKGKNSHQCSVHGDPLVCLACEAEEDARPEWQKPHRVIPPRLRGEPEREPTHRCSGCGHRWAAPEGFVTTTGAELCGDCWRTGQSAIFSRESATPLNAEAGAVDDATSVGAQNSSLRRELLSLQQSLETVKGERDHWKRIAEDWRNELVAEINKRFAALLRERPQEP